MRTDLKAHLLLSLTVVLWAVNFIALKLIYKTVEPPGLALLRLLAVSVFFLVLAKLRKEELSYPPGLAPRILFQGFLAFGLYMVLFLEGLNKTSPAVTAILMAAAPIVTALISVVLKTEKFRLGLFVGAVCAFIGVGMTMMSSAAKGNVLGEVLVLTSAFVWAISVNVLRPVLTEISPFRAMTLSLPGAYLALVPYGIVKLIQTPWHAQTPAWWLMFGHVSLLSSGVAFVTYYAGIQLLGTGRAVMYHFFVPPLTVLLGFAVLRTPMVPMQWVGMAVIIGGVAYALRKPAETA